jgi:hypothetical protein
MHRAPTAHEAPPVCHSKEYLWYLPSPSSCTGSPFASLICHHSATAARRREATRVPTSSDGARLRTERPVHSTLTLTHIFVYAGPAPLLFVNR